MGKVNKSVLVGIIALSMSACSTIKTNELSKEESLSLKDKTLIMSQYKELPDFPATTAANVQFGLMGAFTAISNGNEMIKKNSIEDPAKEISRKLAVNLKNNFNLKVVDEANTLVSSNDIDGLVSAYNNYDYILDVRTLSWQSVYYLSDLNNYKVRYTAHARLIDAKTKNVVAEEVCNSAPEYENSDLAPSYEDLENGSGLRKELAKSVEFCVDHIKNMVKLSPQIVGKEVASLK